MLSSKKILSTIIISFLLIHFSFGQKDAQTIVDRCIKMHGGKKVMNGAFSYDFRKHTYTYHRNGGTFTYTRQHKESGIKDILTNDGISRFDGDNELKLSEKQQKAYTNSVNSVHYFTFLPYFLNDPAVNKKLLGTVIIKGASYYKIEVTFDQKGGGDDHDDVYVYWINKKRYTLDYLGYSYYVNGGGVRFRSAYNPRKVGGVRFQDYVNYKHDKNTEVSALDGLYESGALKELSKIELKNILKIKK